jgi:lauroyl/myristoyl acyltransferase
MKAATLRVPLFASFFGRRVALTSTCMELASMTTCIGTPTHPVLPDHSILRRRR